MHNTFGLNDSINIFLNVNCMYYLFILNGFMVINLKIDF